MRHKTLRLSIAVGIAILVAAALLVRSGCSDAPPPAPKPGELIEVARSDGALWTGVTVTPAGRIFVCHPLWVGPHRDSLVELLAGGRRRAFPDPDSNLWTPGAQIPLPKDAWVCVQSVRADGEKIWVLDAGNPSFHGIVAGAPKLTLLDGPTRRFVRWFRFTPAELERDSYLNDVRVDAAREVAYITDSGAGAILVLDLKSGRSRRVLADHPSTKAEEGVLPRVEGVELRYGPGPATDTPANPMRVHANGLALDPAREWLYWQALTGKTLWRAPTAVLRDASLSAEQVAAAVERVGETLVADGLEMDEDGNLYLAAIEKSAIVVRRPDGRMETLVADPRLAWPDTLALGPNGTLYVTTSQIHRTPLVSPNTAMPRTPFLLYVTARAQPVRR